MSHESAKPTRSAFRVRRLTSLQRRNVKLASLTAIVIAIVVFPYGWVGVNFRPFGRWMDRNFASEFSHHVAHAVLYAIFSAFLLIAFPSLLRRPPLFALAIVAIASAQEGFQLWYKSRLVASNDGIDLLVDLAAAAVVYVVAYTAATIRRNRSNASQQDKHRQAR